MARETIAVFGSCINEESNLTRFLEHHKWADEIIITDSGSTDGSVALCKKYGRTVFQRPLNANHNERTQYTVSKTKSDWILLSDPDEIITDELKEEIFKVLEDLGVFME